MIFFESIEKWTSLANSHHLKGIPAESPLSILRVATFFTHCGRCYR